MDELDVVASQLKMINIPCMFDIGVTSVDPTDQQLNLNIVDDLTFTEIKSDIKKNELMPKWKIENTKLAMEALHHNLYCSEVEITFNGYSVDVDGTRTMYNYKSRDYLKKKLKEEEEKAEREKAERENERRDYNTFAAHDVRNHTTTTGD